MDLKSVRSLTDFDSPVPLVNSLEFWTSLSCGKFGPSLQVNDKSFALLQTRFIVVYYAAEL